MSVVALARDLGSTRHDVLHVLDAQVRSLREPHESAREELLRVQARERAFSSLAAPARGTNRIDDVDITHRESLRSANV